MDVERSVKKKRRKKQSKERVQSSVPQPAQAEIGMNQSKINVRGYTTVITAKYYSLSLSLSPSLFPSLSPFLSLAPPALHSRL